jgi:methionyl-tRNA formyltransferase
MVEGPPLRVVFLGTPEFAVPTLDALLASRHEVVAVVTQPDRPRGRGQKLAFAPVKTRAASAGVPVLQPTKLKDAGFVDAFNAFRPDLGVVAAYGRILPAALIAAPRLGMINVHASLLPRYRGAAPIHRAIMAGEVVTGVTIMRVVEALDAGPMMAVVERPIGPDETSQEVERSLAEAGARLLVDVAERLAAGQAREVPQDERLATYANRITRDDGLIQWGLPAATIHNLVRGLVPWPHAFTFLEGARLIVIQSKPLGPGGSHPEAGTIVKASGDELVVAAGDGFIQLLTVQPEGRRALTAREFLAGHAIRVGSRFGPHA